MERRESSINNYAIIGSGGFIAPRHVTAIESVGGVVYTDCDIDPSKKAHFLDYREMLNDNIMNMVDAVVICTPNHLHAEMARASLYAGKRVLCEKPLTINTDFSFLDDISVVLQLRYHPLFLGIVEALRGAKEVNVVLRAYRDARFYNCWKGDEQKSGGVVYILGSHIFDLLIYALGNKYKLLDVEDSMKRSSGTIMFGNIRVNFDLTFLNDRDGQTRHLEIDGKKWQLSVKDNLSFEGLHDLVYEAFLAGTAPKLSEVIPSIVLLDKIKKQG